MSKKFVQTNDPIPFENLDGWEYRTSDIDPADAWDTSKAWMGGGRTFIWDDDDVVVWMRQEWTVPADWIGRALVLDIVARSSQQTYIGDEPIGAGSWHVITPSAQTGTTYRLAVRIDRGTRPGLIAHSRIHSYPTSYTRWLELRQTLGELVPEKGLTLDGWHVASEDDGPLSDPEIDHDSWPTRKLGEEWREDDSCYWYRMRITVPTEICGYPTEGSPLHLTAMFNRRGSIWIDGEEKAEFARDYGFAVISANTEPGTNHTIAIRVPANRAGWLRDAWLQPKALAEAIAAEEILNDELALWDRFLKLRPDVEFVEALCGAPEPLIGAVPGDPATGLAIQLVLENLSALRDRFEGDAPLVAMPYIQSSKTDSMVVRAESLFARKASLILTHPDGNTTSYTDKASRFHRFELTSLVPDTEYGYTLTAVNITTESRTFSTAPNDPRPVTLTVWGDSHYGPGILEGIVNQISEIKPDLMLTAGDIVGDGINDWEFVDHLLHPIRYADGALPIHFTPGNHDHGGWQHGGRDDNPHLQNRFEPVGTELGDIPFCYSLDYGGVHVVFVDALYGIGPDKDDYGLTKDTPQLEWLRQDLRASRDAHWTILLVHAPPFCETWEGGYYDGEVELRDHLVPVMEEYRVDLCISGHAHTYERGLPHPPYDPETGEGNTVSYLVTGGGGSQLDNRKYREWQQIDIPPHRVDPDLDERKNDIGEYYRYHFCEIKAEKHRLECTAHWVRTDGTIVDTLDSFILRKGIATSG